MKYKVAVTYKCNTCKEEGDFFNESEDYEDYALTAVETAILHGYIQKHFGDKVKYELSKEPKDLVGLHIHSKLSPKEFEERELGFMLELRHKFLEIYFKLAIYQRYDADAD